MIAIAAVDRNWAIGNKGQNAKLAAKLTGFKIDIKPQFDNLTGDEAPELSDDYVVPVKDTADEETEDISAETAEENAAEAEE